MEVTDSFQEETFRMETKLYANWKIPHIQESDLQSYQKKKARRFFIPKISKSLHFATNVRKYRICKTFPLIELCLLFPVFFLSFIYSVNSRTLGYGQVC